jgi:hypothetical protein
VHTAQRVALRHFLVQNAAPRRHPLDVAGTERALVAQAVPVLHRARQNIGNRFDAAVRVPGKAGPVIVGPIVPEIVEQQKGIEGRGVAEAKGPPQLHPGALNGRSRLRDPLHRTYGHGTPPEGSSRDGALIRVHAMGKICEAIGE